MPPRDEVSGERLLFSLDRTGALSTTREAAAIAATIDDLYELQTGALHFREHVTHVTDVLRLFASSRGGGRVIFHVLASVNRGVDATVLDFWIRLLESM